MRMFCQDHILLPDISMIMICLLLAGKLPGWVGKFSVHELDVKGAEEVFRERVNLPGAYAVRKACPMEFVKRFMGRDKIQAIV